MISSSNAEPGSIWSRVELNAAGPFRLDPITDSTRMITNAVPNPGLSLADEMWSTGVPVGYSSTDGVLRPGYQYSLYITTLARVTFVGS